MGWSIEHGSASPVYGPLRVHGGTLFGTAWPELEDYQRILDRREPAVRVASGRPLTVVRQGRKPVVLEERFEARLYLRGELQVRRDNWHDYFNVLVWLAFPRSKAALNARHFAALGAQRAAGAANRGPAQDALTLFDEGGVVMISADAGLLRLVREFRWKELFWENRDRLEARARFILFGHALYEKMLRPFRGITGRGILLEVEPGLLTAPPGEQLDAVDARVAATIADPASFAATRELAVVPVFGVPGWHPDNARAAFYDDTDYFRAGRRLENRG
jgi:Protein of unknown function (DUF3025)